MVKVYSEAIINTLFRLKSGNVIIKGRRNHIIITNQAYLTEVTEEQWSEICETRPELIKNGVLWAESDRASAKDHLQDSNDEYQEQPDRPKTSDEIDEELKNETKPNSRRKKVS